jgi:antitoxin ParD1/3/4
VEAAENTIVVDLGPLRKIVDDRIEAGTYASADEVIRAGLLALEREETAADEWLAELAQEAMSDARPSVPAAQAFHDLRARYGRPAKAS